MFLIWISYELLQAQKWWDFQPETPLSLIPLCCFRLLIRQTQNSFLVCDGSDFVVQFMLKFIFTYLLQFNIWLHHLLLLTFSFFFPYLCKYEKCTHCVLSWLKNILIVCSLDWYWFTWQFNFRGIISSCFEPYLAVYVELEEKSLMEHLEKLVQV